VFVDAADDGLGAGDAEPVYRPSPLAEQLLAARSAR
jgi:hypothetical protein